MTGKRERMPAFGHENDYLMCEDEIWNKKAKYVFQKLRNIFCIFVQILE